MSRITIVAAEARPHEALELSVNSPVQGSCLCGAVRYQIDGPIRGAEYCHCSMCRKAHGTAFSANAEVAATDFRWVQGRDRVVVYASSPERRKCFCGTCGCHLLIERLDDPSTVAITLGTLDSDPGIRPSRHVFVDSKAPWYALSDDLPRFRIYPGFEPTDSGRRSK